MILAKQLCEAAKNDSLLGIPYSKLDCQAFVERCFADAGWFFDSRGSNDMWRNYVCTRTPLASGILDEVPPGAAVFTIKQDGGEVERGYDDNMGNAAHVGLYVGDGEVRHSTTGGVQKDVISNKNRWTHYALWKEVEYKTQKKPFDDLMERIDKTIEQWRTENDL
jgi:cell wall-associated NlpC family hydrolase